MAINAKLVSKRLLDIAEKGTLPFRAKMNKLTHVMDFSFSALQLSDPQLTETEYTTLLVAIRSSGKFDISKSLTYTMRKIAASETKLDFKALVYDSVYGTYLVTSSYGVLQKTLASILKTTESTSRLVQKNATGVWQANIGHIASNLLDATKTPLSALLTEIIKKVPIKAANPIIEQLHYLQNTHDMEASYEFQRPNFNTNTLNKILGKGSVLVTLHSFDVNNKLATEVEGPIASRIKKYLASDEFVDHLLNTKGSLSISEEIKQSMVSLLNGTFLISNHKAKPVSTSKTTKKSSGTLVVSKPPRVPVRNLQGQFYSLANLQILLNTHLQDVISANMGNQGYPGGQRKILNYRTGRFAASASVERMSLSREGAITAFYSYMKNPYQTFEPGFAQGSPKTRDPKLLIAKSIRDIAASKVSNRMRAVSI